MELTMQERIERVARWAGFVYLEGTVMNKYILTNNWKRPDGVIAGCPNFPEDLNAEFKWLEKPLVDHFIETTPTEEAYRWAYHNFHCRWLSNYVWHKPHKPALALFEAVEQVIEKEGQQ